jgi:hypothetical protein
MRLELMKTYMNAVPIRNHGGVQPVIPPMRTTVIEVIAEMP